MPPSSKPSRATGRVTLAHVAERAGVSPITVSRALRGVASVDPALAARVQEAVAALGYVPDSAARALASRTSAHVTVLVPLLSNALFIELVDAAQAVFHAAGFQMLMGVTHYDPAEEEQLLREQLAHRPAGLLLTGFGQTAATQRLVAGGVPVVHVMETRRRAGVHSVGFSQTAAAAALTRHLIQRGRRRIAFVAVQMDARTLQRRRGWQAALHAAGLDAAGLSFEDPRASSMALGAELLARVLAERPDVDSIFFCNDDLAQGALLEALRRGIAVPGRLAVAGFNDLPGSDQMVPPLTTVRTPRRDIGTQAAQRLLALIRGDDVHPAALDVGYTLVVRDSA
ncbi:LacI family DNA-binding transcriptional regulator [Ottowia testudinis]|uniref:LacI family DNA-binding transcriptional regulator n=1 Tax=Ottowia testudinis TaxID=2816950 RepID=A0A975CDZ5_9BURK|nr:LacI family DNA-binding transcriptional regulator [Ottowia testudinis]QTD44693.1 LacI family DNA-binding transcriptional regulator [Ottowia testudinis]